MKVAVGFDHAGVPFHDVVVDAVRAEGHEPVDVGTQDDYPDAARDVSRAVHAGDCDRGIVVCGSGAGVAVAACKLPGIRAAVGHDTYTAAQCVQHDACNVLALGARVIGPMVAASCVRVRDRRVLGRGASRAAARKDRRHRTGRVRRLMRVIDLDTGDTLQAANDDDLRKAVAGFYEDRNEPMNEDDVARLVERRAYDATDS